jgi:hypothetical protein
MSQTLDGYTETAPEDDWMTPSPAAATRRCYTFAVYVAVREPVDEDDVDGYTQADVEALVKRLLASYASRREAGIFGGDVAVDWELLESVPESAPFASRP